MMLTQSLSTSSFPLQELERLNHTICAALDLVGTLEKRRDELEEQLEYLTRPAKPIPVAIAIAIAVPQPVDRRPRFEYRGTSFAHWSNVAVYLELLRRLWVDFPDQREKIAVAISRHGTQRNYVGTTREHLFPGHTKGWARRHSRILVNGWFADANLNVERMAKLAETAVKAAGLTWSGDVRVSWR